MSSLACLSFGRFRIIKIPISDCGKNKKIRSAEIKSLKEKLPFFKLHQIFAFLENGDFLTFDIYLDTFNIFNETINGLFTVWERLDIIHKDSVKEIAADIIDDDDSIKARYISSFIFLEDNNQICASEIVDSLDDFLISRLVTNAYAFEDKLFALNQLRFAIKSQEGRFLEGRTHYTYDPSSIDCAFETLQILMLDPKAIFYPYHPKSSFDSRFILNASNFIGHRDTQIPFNSLKWDAEKIDLSVFSHIEGHIKIFSRDAKEHNLPETIETYTKRKFYFIRNGVLETAKIYFSASAEVLKLLESNNIAIKENDGWYVDFSSLPLISRKFSVSKITGPILYEIIINLIQEKKKLYGLKHIKNKLYPTVKNSFEDFYNTLTNEQKKFIETDRNIGIYADGFRYNDRTLKRGPHDIKFYITDKDGENDVSKLAFIAEAPLTSISYSLDKLKDSFQFMESFSLSFFDSPMEKPSIELEKQIEQTLIKIIELEFKIQHFRLVCITRDWWTTLVTSGFRGYTCENGDLKFTEESLYA